MEDVIDLPPGERDIYLDRACAGDVGIRTSVDELLRSDPGSSVFLEPPWSLDDDARPRRRTVRSIYQHDAAMPYFHARASCQKIASSLDARCDARVDWRRASRR